MFPITSMSHLRHLLTSSFTTALLRLLNWIRNKYCTRLELQSKYILYLTKFYRVLAKTFELLESFEKMKCILCAGCSSIIMKEEKLF